MILANGYCGVPCILFYIVRMKTLIYHAPSSQNQEHCNRECVLVVVGWLGSARSPARYDSPRGPADLARPIH
jgi:hypothetical protein